MLSPATFQPFRQRHVAGETINNFDFVNDNPQRKVGPTYFLVKELVPPWQYLPQRHVAGETVLVVCEKSRPVYDKFFSPATIPSDMSLGKRSPATCRWGND
ncbi:hypothetical protein Tco_1543164 [Tanacetum coccineum]